MDSDLLAIDDELVEVWERIESGMESDVVPDLETNDGGVFEKAVI